MDAADEDSEKPNKGESDVYEQWWCDTDGQWPHHDQDLSQYYYQDDDCAWGGGTDDENQSDGFQPETNRQA